MSAITEDISHAADKFVTDLLKIRAGNKLLIYCDANAPMDVSSSVQKKAEEAGATVVVHLVDPRHELPKAATILNEIIEQGLFDVICELSEQYFYQTPAWKTARIQGARAYSLAGLDAQAFVRCVGKVDQKVMHQFGETLRKAIVGSGSARIQCAAGTNLKMEFNAPWIYNLFPLSRRKPKASIGHPSGFLNGDRSFTFMGGQLAFQPIPRSIEGTAIIDGYFWPPTAISEIKDDPVVLHIKKGQVVHIDGCPAKSKLLAQWFGNQPKPVKHFCLGFNPGAYLSGKILEAERTFGTLSIGMANYPHHADGIIRRPTIMLDDEAILVEGTYQGREIRGLLEKFAPGILHLKNSG